MIVVEVNALMVAHEHDPDPADDEAVDEPAMTGRAAEERRSTE